MARDAAAVAILGGLPAFDPDRPFVARTTSVISTLGGRFTVCRYGSPVATLSEAIASLEDQPVLDGTIVFQEVVQRFGTAAAHSRWMWACHP
jgi:hypothetical protein